jgi:hypothetical protein
MELPCLRAMPAGRFLTLFFGSLHILPTLSVRESINFVLVIACSRQTVTCPPVSGSALFWSFRVTDRRWLLMISCYMPLVSTSKHLNVVCRVALRRIPSFATHISCWQMMIVYDLIESGLSSQKSKCTYFDIHYKKFYIVLLRCF